ncbi:MAG TPA: FMN-binding negative transcriptional regulator [Pseudomonadales bacterium]|nr:FMN-binding negative transcriptional regulator [Pseudomonadales bacterium]
MYNPTHFAETDRAAQLALIDRHPFGTLMTVSGGKLSISTIPFLLGADGASLIGHVARANPHWREFAAATDVAVGFIGPHAYISPTWYSSPNMVPTWNYVAVEVRGTIELLEDREARLDVVDRLSARHEAALPQPWRSAKMDPTLRDKLLEAIVAFRVSITSIDAKAKLGQNRKPDDVRGAAAALRALSTESAEARLAALMLDAIAPS